MKIRWEHIAIGVLLLVASFSTFKWVGALKQIDQGQIENQRLDSMVNKYGQVVITQDAIITENKYALKQLTDSMFALTKSQDRKIRDVISFYEGRTTTVIKEVKVPYTDSFAFKKFSDSIKLKCLDVIEYYEAHSITVPRTAKDSTKNYSIDIVVQKDSVKVNNIIIPDVQRIRFVTTKGGLLKRNSQGKLKLWLKPTIQAQVIHSNPLVHVTGQTSAIYQPPIKPRILEKSLLIGAGMFIGTKL